MTNAAIAQIEGQLERVVIHLTWHDRAGKPNHGTAFFVSADGVALTAFHNIADTLAADPAASITGRWQGQNVRFGWKLATEAHAAWQREHDIAVLQAEQAPVGLVTLTTGHLDPALNDGRRSVHWAGSRVVMAGFSRGREYGLAAGDGNVHPNPLGAVEIRGKKVRALKFGSSLVSSGIDDGPGLSGSPVFSPADGAIVGITIAAYVELHAAELWPISANWEGSRSFMVKLKPRRPDHPPPPPIKWALLIACLALLAVAGGMLWRQRTGHTIPPQFSAQVSRMDAGTSETVTDGSVFRTGERVRFHFVASKDGHLYVVDQEIVGGRNQEPLIIFPTLRTGAGRNLVKAGTSVDFPSQDDDPPYLEASASGQPGYEGEVLTLLIFRHPLPVALKETPVPLEPALFSLDGLRPRGFIHPLAPPDDALAIRRIRLQVTK